MPLIFYPDSFGQVSQSAVPCIFADITQLLCQGILPRHETSDTLYIVRQTQGDYPMISCVQNGVYVIRLDTYDNYWSQYAYQYAHEYCHYLIRGEMSGKLQGLLWLEESICELASLCGLAHLSRIWRQRGNAYWQAFEEYLTDLLTRGECPEGSLAGYIDAHLHLLGESVYHRDLYHNIALALYPTFREDPSLWSLLPYMGNMVDYATLQEWLTGLQSRIPEELHQQYCILRGVLM